MSAAADTATVLHRGGCHCQRIRFEFTAPARIVAWDCNCSICLMKRNTHTIVPGHAFKLTSGEDSDLSCYQFGTRTARHLFCRHCGVCSFYVPRSNPDGVAITVHCIDPGSVEDLAVRNYDGRNWETAYEATGIASETGT